MKKSKTDRRVKYTKTMLKNALVQLMQKHHISGISVKSLCETADINRSTFYAHYTDQYDLLRQTEEEVMTNIRLHLEKQDYKNNLPVSLQVLTRILEYAKENADLFKVLISENCDFAFQKDILEFSHVVSSQYNKTLNERTKDYLQQFGIAGCISIFQKWLKDGTVESAANMSALIIQALQFGIVSFQK